MCRKTHTATLTPGGLAVDGVEIGAAKIIVMARPSTKMATCPECGAVSGRIHSRYRRRLIDLPAHGRIVEINVETRRFRCVGTGCRRRIFVQRLGDAVALPSAREIMRQQKAPDLDPWIVAAIASPLSSFAKGIIADRDAVQAAIIQPWSNGQTEGQIIKLKLVKRQMYERAKIDLLEARVIGAA